MLKVVPGFQSPVPVPKSFAIDVSKTFYVPINFAIETFKLGDSFIVSSIIDNMDFAVRIDSPGKRKNIIRNESFLLNLTETVGFGRWNRYTSRCVVAYDTLLFGKQFTRRQ